MKKGNTKKKDGMSGGKMATMATLGAGVYYLLGPDAKAHQKKASVLMGKIKKEVGSEMKKAKKASEPMYHKLIDVISSNYIKQYGAHEGEIKALNKKLKSEWKGAEKLAKKTAKKADRSLKK